MLRDWYNIMLDIILYKYEHLSLVERLGLEPNKWTSTTEAALITTISIPNIWDSSDVWEILVYSH